MTAYSSAVWHNIFRISQGSKPIKKHYAGGSTIYPDIYSQTIVERHSTNGALSANNSQNITPTTSKYNAAAPKWLPGMDLISLQLAQVNTIQLFIRSHTV